MQSFCACGCQDTLADAAAIRYWLRAKPAWPSVLSAAQLRPPARSLRAPASRWNRRRAARHARAQRGRRIARCRSACRGKSSMRSRWRISGLRPSVPVPLQGTSARTRSKAESSSSAVASASRHSMRSPIGGEALAQFAQAAAHSASQATIRRLRIALGEDQGLSAGRRAGIRCFSLSWLSAAPAHAAISPTNCDPSS